MLRKKVFLIFSIANVAFGTNEELLRVCGIGEHEINLTPFNEGLKLYGNHSEEICALAHYSRLTTPEIVSGIYKFLENQWVKESEYKTGMILSLVCPRPLGPVPNLRVFEDVVATGDRHLKPLNKLEVIKICELLKRVSMNPKVEEAVNEDLIALKRDIDNRRVVAGRISTTGRNTWEDKCSSNDSAKWNDATKSFISQYEILLNMQSSLAESEIGHVCDAFTELDNALMTRDYNSRKLIPLYQTAFGISQHDEEVVEMITII